MAGPFGAPTPRNGEGKEDMVLFAPIALGAVDSAKFSECVPVKASAINMPAVWGGSRRDARRSLKAGPYSSSNNCRVNSEFIM